MYAGIGPVLAVEAMPNVAAVEGPDDDDDADVAGAGVGAAGIAVAIFSTARCIDINPCCIWVMLRARSLKRDSLDALASLSSWTSWLYAAVAFCFSTSFLFILQSFLIALPQLICQGYYNRFQFSVLRIKRTECIP